MNIQAFLLILLPHAMIHDVSAKNLLHENEDTTGDGVDDERHGRALDESYDTVCIDMDYKLEQHLLSDILKERQGIDYVSISDNGQIAIIVDGDQIEIYRYPYKESDRIENFEIDNISYSRAKDIICLSDENTMTFPPGRQGILNLRERRRTSENDTNSDASPFEPYTNSYMNDSSKSNYSLDSSASALSTESLQSYMTPNSRSAAGSVNVYMYDEDNYVSKWQPFNLGNINLAVLSTRGDIIAVVTGSLLVKFFRSSTRWWGNNWIEWEQYGQSIELSSDIDSLVMSEDGRTFAIQYCLNQSDKDAVKVFNYYDGNGTWVQYKDEIIGNDSCSSSSKSLSMSSNGKIISIGTKLNSSALVRILERKYIYWYQDWIEDSFMIKDSVASCHDDDDDICDSIPMSLSSTGDVLAVGIKDQMNVFIKYRNGYYHEWEPFTFEINNSTLKDHMSNLSTTNGTETNHSTVITSIGAISSTAASRVVIKTSQGFRIFNFHFRCNEYEAQPSYTYSSEGIDFMPYLIFGLFPFIGALSCILLRVCFWQKFRNGEEAAAATNQPARQESGGDRNASEEGMSTSMIERLPSSLIKDVVAELPKHCQDCTICMEPFVNGECRKVLPCLHGFHNNCIDEWLLLNNSCPVCRFENWEEA